jgi:formate-dependent nitrite reductase membrane component NrfD
MPTARVAFDVFHPRPWGWPVALYLWTKGAAAGAFVLLFLAVAAGLAEVSFEMRIGASFVSLAFLGLTALLLVGDLKRPERFWQIIVRPQWRSWLAIGAFILTGYAGLLGLWFLGTLAGIDSGVLLALGSGAAVLGVLTALYTAFLFAQCEARDLWQSPMVGFVLLAQATIMGAAIVLSVAVVTGTEGSLIDVARAALAGGALLNVVALLLGEAFARHATTNARAAADLLVRGPWWHAFWLGGLALAGLVPLIAAAAPIETTLVAEAGLAAAIGLLWYELGFVQAGQAVPIS